MRYYESLQDYYKNECVLHPGQDPVWGEVGYKEYMKKCLSDMGIKSGDVIRVEQKWDSNKTETFEGIVLQMYEDRFYMLSQGKKVWKDKENRKDIVISRITEIKKIKDAAPGFDICKADPNYKAASGIHEDADFWKNIEEKRMRKFKESISTVFPQIDFDKNVLLWLLFDFCWTYSDGEVQNAEITIIKKNGENILLPKYKNKHIYPNRDYHSCCGITETDKNHGGLSLLFESFEELLDIRFISCLWTVRCGRYKLQFLQIVYPHFIKGNGNIYNIACRCTDMRLYERSLHTYSVFSGALEKEYDKAFVRSTGPEGETIMNIMNAEDIEREGLVDAIICLYSNDFSKVMESTDAEKQEIAEVFIKNADIEPKGYIWKY